MKYSKAGQTIYHGDAIAILESEIEDESIDLIFVDPPYNIGGYPSYDNTNFYHGKHTPLDQMDVINEAKPASANPMDPNWGGKAYTQELLDNDYYRANEVHFYP